MPLGPIGYTTLASTTVNAPDETAFFETSVPALNLINGTNLLTVEVHQASATSSDLGFDLELVGTGVRVEETPVLQLEAMSGELKLSWPASATSFKLYSSPEVGPSASWTMANDSPTLTNGQNVLRITPGAGTRFYQLRSP
jgi:hypothetical protein